MNCRPTTRVLGVNVRTMFKQVPFDLPSTVVACPLLYNALSILDDPISDPLELGMGVLAPRVDFFDPKGARGFHVEHERLSLVREFERTKTGPSCIFEIRSTSFRLFVFTKRTQPWCCGQRFLLLPAFWLASWSLRMHKVCIYYFMCWSESNLSVYFRD